MTTVDRDVSTMTPAGLAGGVAALLLPVALQRSGVPWPLLVPLSAAWWSVLVLAWWDWRTHRLPNPATAALAAAALLTAGLYGLLGVPGWSWAPVLAGGAGFAIVGALEALPEDSLGAGDAKLLAALGLWSGFLGWSAVVGAFFAAHLAMIVTLLIARRRGQGHPALGPAIAVGVGVAWCLAAASGIG